MGFKPPNLSLIDLIVFFSGFSIMVIEILGARMFVPFMGNTFYVWTSIIGVVMASMSVGYYRGGVEGDLNADTYGLSKILFKAAISCAFIPFLLIIGFTLGGHSVKWGPIIATLIGLAPSTYHLAKVSPYCIRLKTTSVEKTGRTSGSIYALSTVGSIFGTFLSGFFLIQYFELRTTILSLAAALFLLSLSLGFPKNKIDKIFYTLFFIFFIIINLTLTPSSTSLTTPIDSIPLLELETPYSSISVFEMGHPDNNSRKVRVLKLGRLIQGGIFLDDNSSYYEYSYLAQMAWLYNNEPNEVLILGNGAGIFVDKIAKTYPHVNIDVVDIDPEVFRVAQDFFPEKEGDNVNFYVDDARLYLKKTNKKYDIILMDVFGSTQQAPFHLVTDQMNRLVDKRLSADGVYVQNIVSAIDGEKSLLFKSVMKTTLKTFPNTLALPVDQDAQKLNTIVILSPKGEYRGGLDQILATMPVEKRDLVNISFERYIQKKVEFDYEAGLFLTDEHAPTETMNI